MTIPYSIISMGTYYFSKHRWSITQLQPHLEFPQCHRLTEAPVRASGCPSYFALMKTQFEIASLSCTPWTHKPKTKQQYSIKRPDLASVIICLTFQLFLWVTQKVTWVSGLFEYTWQAITGQKIIKDSFFEWQKYCVAWWHGAMAAFRRPQYFLRLQKRQKRNRILKEAKVPFVQSVTTSLYLKFLWADGNPLVSLMQIHLMHQSIILSHDRYRADTWQKRQGYIAS